MATAREAAVPHLLPPLDAGVREAIGASVEVHEDWAAQDVAAVVATLVGPPADPPPARALRSAGMLMPPVE